MEPTKTRGMGTVRVWLQYDAAHGLVRMVRLTKNEASMCQFMHKRKRRSSFPGPIIGKAPASHSAPFPTLSILRSAAASKRQGRSLGDGSRYYPARSNDYRNGPNCRSIRVLQQLCSSNPNSLSRNTSTFINLEPETSSTRPLTRFLPDTPGY